MIKLPKKSRRRKIVILVTAGFTLFLLSNSCSLFGIRTTEEPAFSIVEREGNFQVRQYQPYIIAVTYVEGADQNTAGNIAFRRLFRYISGENSKQQGIPMTAPVIASKDDGTKIPMTAPVIASKEGNKWRYAFVMPVGFTLENTPVPNGKAIKILQIPARQMAVLRYSGRWTDKNRQAKLTELNNIIRNKNLNKASNPIYAAYDPPWTIPLFRRNEVMLEIH